MATRQVAQDVLRWGPSAGMRRVRAGKENRRLERNIEAIQTVQTPDEGMWGSSKPQDVIVNYEMGDETNGASWNSGEITESKNGDGRTVTDNVFVDIDPEQLQTKPSCSNWNGFTDNTRWLSGIDFATPPSSSPLLGDHDDIGHIQQGDIQELLNLLLPDETCSSNRGK